MLADAVLLVVDITEEEEEFERLASVERLKLRLEGWCVAGGAE